MPDVGSEEGIVYRGRGTAVRLDNQSIMGGIRRGAYAIALQGPQGCRALQTDWRVSMHTLGHMSSPSVSQDETQFEHNT